MMTMFGATVRCALGRAAMINSAAADPATIPATRLMMDPATTIRGGSGRPGGSEYPHSDLPDLPDLPELPDLADLPDLPDLPDPPDLPDLLDLPDLPDLPD